MCYNAFTIESKKWGCYVFVQFLLLSKKVCVNDNAEVQTFIYITL
jgi:hypothetical protein